MITEAGLTPDQRIKLKSLIIKHEGEKNFPYLDNCNPPNITIGIGRNLTGTGIRDDEKALMYDNDVNFLVNHLSKTYSWFSDLSENRQLALIDMAFMGIKHFDSFKKMFACFEIHNYQGAAMEILDSSYAKKLPLRANNLANIIISDQL